MELFSAFGLDIKVLVAQLVNFCVLGFILYKIGYKPILKFVQDRTATIAQGIKTAGTAKEALAKAQAEHAHIITAAKTEATAVLERAKNTAVEQGNRFIERSQTEAQKLLDKARQDIRLEHDKMMEEAKGELATLVILATEKLLQKKVDPTVDQAFIAQTLAQVRSKKKV